ncbi:hypothetical protein BDY19DRAFT_535709 [Irpex rosettiformis]|uniref:Uncharacterized protein n=1 Tax=Irpex rosettiformis TaxID=378272 RepID=A0ACB8TQS1_9APHY|nr:hypothetical protein BDY19DRAFT_535709 [Irpex rosettiformis]
MTVCWNALLLWLSLAASSVVVWANPDDRFIWKFGGNFVASTISECQNLSVIVEANATSTYMGVPPYYLFALVEGGVPSVSLIGSNPNQLTWQNKHQRGSTLMLTVMDSNFSTGGVSPTVYNITEGTQTSCLPASTDALLPPAIPSITPNVTGKIETCQPWGLTISGGTKPYLILLAALNSPVVTNVTMGGNDDVFTYIDRADPNELLMASVVDATGKWGISSPLILPSGSNDTNCTGLISTSQTTAQIEQQAQARAASAREQHDHHRHVAIGVGVGVGVGIPLLLIIGGLLFLRRRARRGMGMWDSKDYTPRAWHQNDNDDATNSEMRENGQIAPVTSQPSSTRKLPVYTPTQTPLPSPPFSPDAGATPPNSSPVTAGRSSTTLGLAATSSSSSPPPPQTPPPQTPPPATNRERPGKNRPGSALRTATSTSTFHTLTPSQSQAAFGGSTPQLLDPDVLPDIIIQHRDGGPRGGGVVHELPPPYVDRSGEEREGEGGERT